VPEESGAKGLLHTARLDLEPLRVGHADELAPLLDDPCLHTFIGGVPATAAQLRERYGRLAAGWSPDGAQRWLNWLVRRRDTGLPVGTVQATVVVQDGLRTAKIAWVVAVPHQGQGLATEAAQAMVAWLRSQGVDVVLAHVHPGHAASAAVARAVGLTATDVVVDGETRWRG
jgi:RimJ/RimL family protein N-acetyltransferase